MIGDMPIAPTSSGGFRFGPFEFDRATGELRKGGTKIRLNRQAVQVLTALLENAGHLITREELRSNLWPEGTFVDFDHSLNAAVNRLRQRLGDSAENCCYIATIPGRGYRFIAPVTTIPSPEAPIEAVLEPEPVRRPRFHRFAIAISLGLLLTFSVLVDSYGRRPAPIRSLALLPFDNISRDADQEYFVDGMSEALITELGRTPDLRVVSNSSTIGYKGSRKPLSTISKELGVDYVVQGAVARSGTRLRVTVRLVDPPTGRLIWSEAYEREMGDVLLLQDEISRAVAGELKSRVQPEVEPSLQAKKRTLKPEAIEAYLRANTLRTR